MDTSFQHGFPSNPVKRVATHTREVGMTCSVWLTPSASVNTSVACPVTDLGEHFHHAVDTVGDPGEETVILPRLDVLGQLLRHVLQRFHGVHQRAAGDLTGRREKRPLNGALQSLHRRPQVIILDLVDLPQCVIRLFAAVLHAGQHR